MDFLGNKSENDWLAGWTRDDCRRVTRIARCHGRYTDATALNCAAMIRVHYASVLQPASHFISLPFNLTPRLTERDYLLNLFNEELVFTDHQLALVAWGQGLQNALKLKLSS
jgi:hypothetical protein